MADKIIIRHGTSAEWQAANPVLAAGEIGIETNTNRFKMGNGASAWTSLPYGGGTGDMTVDVYDPTGVHADAFSMGNMKETSSKKIMTAAERTKLAGIEEGANNYQLPADVVRDDQYVHTDNNYTDADKTKLDGVEAGANNYELPESVVHETEYATATKGGVVKMRIDGDTLYITNDGSDA